MKPEQLLDALQKDLRNVNTTYQAHAQIEHIINAHKKKAFAQKEQAENGEKEKAKAPKN